MMASSQWIAKGAGKGFAPKLFPGPAAEQVDLLQQMLQQQEQAQAAAAPAEDAVSLAIREALEPVAVMDNDWTLDEMCSRVAKYLYKSTQRFWNDLRLKEKGSPAHAQAFVTDFVDAVMGAISNACYEKAWFPDTNFAGPIYEALMSICKGTKLFCRVLAPCIIRYCEEGVFRFREEERILNSLTAAIAGSGLPPNHHKKALGHLQNSFDDAFTHAPYGVSAAEDPSTQLLKDFVLGWIRCFVNRSWQMLDNISNADKDQQMLFVTALFQMVVGPEVRCLPIELVNEFGKPDSTGMLPDAGWPFVAEATEEVFVEIEAQIAAKPPKMPRISPANQDLGGAAKQDWGGASQGATGLVPKPKGPIKLQWITHS